MRKLGAEWSWFRLRYKYPSESTIRNVLTRIDAAALDMITCAWLFAQARKSGNDEWEIALDGKVMRGAWTDENDKVTLFSAMLHREAVTIAQVRVPDGTNEITQADAILGTVEIRAGDSRSPSTPAAGNRRNHRREAGWDYLMTVKGNQPSCREKYLTKYFAAAERTTSRRNATRADKRRSCWITARKESTSARAPGRHYPREIFEISGDASARNMLLSTAGKQKR